MRRRPLRTRCRPLLRDRTRRLGNHRWKRRWSRHRQPLAPPRSGDEGPSEPSRGRHHGWARSARL